ncbi:MAG: methyltransferase domain-containing protein [Desulfovibrionaceae bacterium]|nr:methyltransferase domain-containing protein [Desulfovibrionaceae bacterium]MBF0513326.1 methyltransferase domain-containing protein [Desulfovibrionaceae bacterium]
MPPAASGSSGPGPIRILPACSGKGRQRLAVSACGRDWLIERGADLETLWAGIGEDEFGCDERAPYWAEIWPASLLLAEWLAKMQNEIRGAACLDLGCGLGLTAIVAANLGARVVGLDYERPALGYARGNARRNGGLSPLFTLMDWRAPGFAPHSFDFMWGGDILYERRFYEPLRDLFRACLKPCGRVWLAEPRRSVSAPVWEELAVEGFGVRRLTTEPVPVEGYTVTVNLWELAPPLAAARRENDHG